MAKYMNVHRRRACGSRACAPPAPPAAPASLLFHSSDCVCITRIISHNELSGYVRIAHHFQTQPNQPNQPKLKNTHRGPACSSAASPRPRPPRGCPPSARGSWPGASSPRRRASTGVRKCGWCRVWVCGFVWTSPTTATALSSLPRRTGSRRWTRGGCRPPARWRRAWRAPRSA